MPDLLEKSSILAATYTVVLFTILVQGRTLGPGMPRAVRPESQRRRVPARRRRARGM